MRFLKWLGIFLIILIVAYFLGPKPAQPKLTADLPVVPTEAAQLEKYIADGEAKHKVKPENEARIVWLNDSAKEKTEYAVVYIHGFSASQEEGDPVHKNFAKKFGCNLFLARLAEHGIDTTEAMVNLTADKLWNSAKEAYAIGKQTGKKIILMSTSTGGTLALKLAATYPEIAGLILLSPNIAINDANAWLLNNPWGLQIAKLVKGSAYMYAKDTTAIYKKYWYYQYRMESVVQLEELLESAMKASVFEKITQPVLLLYYFKDEKNQDPVVKVSAMKRMFAQLGTVADKKRERAIPNAGDHVIGSPIKSKDVQRVETEMEKFAKEILQLKPLHQ
jgi:esterase/lipase